MNNQKPIIVFACCGVFGPSTPWEDWYLQGIERTFDGCKLDVYIYSVKGQLGFEGRTSRVQPTNSYERDINIDFAIDENTLKVDWTAVAERVLQVGRRDQSVAVDCESDDSFQCGQEEIAERYFEIPPEGFGSEAAYQAAYEQASNAGLLLQFLDMHASMFPIHPLWEHWKGYMRERASRRDQAIAQLKREGKIDDTL